MVSLEATLRELADILVEFEGKLNALSDAQLSDKPLPTKWSKKEVIGHLIDSGHNNLRRFIVGQYETNPKIIYEQDFWVNMNGYQRTDSKSIIQLWVLINRQIITVLQSSADENLRRTCDTGKLTPNLRSIEWLAKDYVKHLKHHLNQVIAGSFDVVYP
jgi:hypothetical protein